MFMLEAKINNIATDVNTRICDTMMKNNNIINLDSVRFAKQHGDILYTFKCPEKLGQVRPMLKDCLGKVPIEGGLYVDPISKIATKHAERSKCNIHFPLTIESKEGWISVGKTIHAAIPPKREMLILDGANLTQHESMLTGGIYQMQAIQNFESLLEFGSFHKAMMQDISPGVCRHEDSCPDSMIQEQRSLPVYDLNKLAKKELEALSHWGAIDKWVQEKG